MNKIFEKYITDDLQVNWEYVETIPEFAKLKDCQQNPKWHSEGTAWVHTVKCVEAAQHLLLHEYKNISLLDKRILIVGVLFHDIGKATTTEYIKENWHSYGHEISGERITRRILWDETLFARESVCQMVRWHMEVLRIADSKDCFSKILKLSCNEYFNWRNLIFVKRCDSIGSEPQDESVHKIDEAKLKFIEQAATYLNCYYCNAYKNSNLMRARIFGRPTEWDGKEKTKVYVCIGLPGAGKDTYASGTELETICRDDIRAELGYCKAGEKIIGTNEQENNVSDVFNKRLKDCILNKKDVIINNLNVRKKYREDYHRLIDNISNNVEWIYVYIEAPTLEDNIKRREGQIKREVFNQIIDKFDWPTADEYDSIIIQKQR